MPARAQSSPSLSQEARFVHSVAVTDQPVNWMGESRVNLQYTSVVVKLWGACPEEKTTTPLRELNSTRALKLPEIGAGRPGGASTRTCSTSTRVRACAHTQTAHREHMSRATGRGYARRAHARVSPLRTHTHSASRAHESSHRAGLCQAGARPRVPPPRTGESGRPRTSSPPPPARRSAHPPPPGAHDRRARPAPGGRRGEARARPAQTVHEPGQRRRGLTRDTASGSSLPSSGRYERIKPLARARRACANAIATRRPTRVGQTVSASGERVGIV